MKHLAHISNDLNSEIISIYEVIKRLEKDPSYKEGITFYSLWYLTPMVAKVNSSKGRAPHFAFKKGHGGNENSGGGKSIEHELAQKIIYDNKFLKISTGKTKDELFFSEIEIEKEFENGERRADLYVKIKNENKFNLPVDSWLVIELYYKHKVEISKKAYYRRHNIAAIEIEIDKDIAYNGDMQLLYRRLSGYLRYSRDAKWLHNPNYKEYYSKRNEQEKEQVNQPVIDYVPPIVHDTTSEDKSNIPNTYIETSIDNEPISNKSKKSFWRKLLDSILIPFS